MERDGLDFGKYHREVLPRLIDAGRGQLAARSAATLRPLAFRLHDGTAFTYQADARGIAVVAGDAGAASVIEIAHDDWCGLVHELEATAGLVYAGRIRCTRGAAVDLMAWESALRALYNGRPLYDPAHLDLRGRDGGPLDHAATFGANADRADMAHFLATTGYLFVRSVFSAGEIDAFLREVDVLRAEARPGDKLSWWGKTDTGAEVLCRVTRGCSKPNLATLATDPRLRALKDLYDPSLVYKSGEGQGVTVIFKQPGMREGLGDLPWHRDCGMGGHAVICPTVAISIYLREATPESGELAMLPGSHRAAFNAHDATLDPNAHAAHFAARPGDVSVHLSDTVHAAPPPTATDRNHYRVSAVVSFARSQAHHHRGEGSYNDVLHQREDGQIEHLEEVAKRL